MSRVATQALTLTSRLPYHSGKETAVRATMTTKGQVTVPQALRTRHGWDAGTKLLFDDLGDGTVLVRAEARDDERWQRAWGRLRPGEGQPQTTGAWLRALRGDDEPDPAAARSEP